MADNNKQEGNHFESDFAGLMYDRGFWTHRLTANAAGQPADIIAVKNGKAYLIDCKVCSGNLFPFSRIEENQQLAMDLWLMRGNTEPQFALRVAERLDYGIPIYRVYMVAYTTLKELMKEQNSISLADIVKYGVEFGKWVQQCE